ncbi:MAG: hypothetical protein LBH32_05860 [Dysgonamonadaceae bacterium]|jgi:hypothetical protein|nr:hypothetical protein [Dysgonamonadaceae bacterium]
MKNLNFLLIAIMALLITACNKDEPKDESIVVSEGTYVGKLTVDQNDGTFYTQENVSVVFLPETKGKAEIKMLQVSFSAKMPLKLDMTIPNITTSEISEGLSLSGDSIVPLAMGGEFPQYTITKMTGKVQPQTLSIALKCGVFPLTFSGIKNN